MKIRKIKYNNHPVLGNLELNLVNDDTGLPYETVVLAGENGTGKTSILASLNTFLCRSSFEYFDSIEYEVEGQLFAALPPGIQDRIKFGFHKRKNLQTNVIVEINRNQSNDSKGIETDTFDIRHCGCVYSKARADYSVKSIKGTTSLEIDNGMYDQDTQEDFSSLKQLIVDVQTEDNELLRRAHEQSTDHQVDYNTLEPQFKISRFRYAFDNFFEAIKYKGVVSENGEKMVQFEKHARTITIDHLSTGEKQIVYRGIYLLRNVGKLDGATIMIDEPELSMHPKWQQRILTYFKDLFKSADGSQKVQMLFATHSEYVLGEALKDKDRTLVIVLKDNNGTIEKQEIRTPLVLPTITTSEINYAAFGIPSIDYHIALYGAIQSIYNKHSIASCDQFIHTQCVPCYDDAVHGCEMTYNGCTYNTLCTKIRNHIDHPDNPYGFTEEELEISIKLMRDIIERIPVTP